MITDNIVTDIVIPLVLKINQDKLDLSFFQM
jgi:hypothetical protein